jgi:hypothetical protein
MATATVSQGKTSFVRDFLKDHPQGNVKVINEAWTGAGNKGTISKAVVVKTRQKLGLTGNMRAKAAPATKQKAASSPPKTPTTTPGKSSFIKEYLHDHPSANARQVSEAWVAAGMQGTIGKNLVSDVRKRLGLAGQARPTTQKPASRTPAPARTPGGKNPITASRAPSGPAQTQGRSSDRATALLAAEVEIDRLLFQMMGLGGATEIENALRAARRAVYKALTP